jgi:hypothetical protein
MGWNQPENEPDQVVMDVDEQELERKSPPRSLQWKYKALTCWAAASRAYSSSRILDFASVCIVRLVLGSVQMR